MYVVVSIEDTKAEEFRGLYLQRTDEAAVRMFSDVIVGGKDNMLRQHPEDFQLVRVGSFDEETGRLEVQDPFVLMTAAAVVRRMVQEDLPHHDERIDFRKQIDLLAEGVPANGA